MSIDECFILYSDISNSRIAYTIGIRNVRPYYSI